MSNASAMASELLSGPAVVGLTIAWIVAWGLVHPLGKCIFKPSAETVWALRYHMRLWRASLYCFLCVLGGSMLMMQDYLSSGAAAEAMLESYSIHHQFFFTMAIGHWTNAICEDWATRQRLDQGMDGAVPLILFGYTYHHVVTIFTYIVILSTRFLGGFQGTLGLLFEAPVLLMTEREVAFATHPKPRWLQDSRRVWWHWFWTYTVFIIFRGGPTVLYVATCIPGNEVHRLLSERLRDPEEYVFYHGLAAFFTLMNPIILCLLKMWHDVDREHLRKVSVDSLPSQETAQVEASKDSVALPPQEAVRSFGAWPGGLDGGSSVSLSALSLAIAAGCIFALHEDKEPDQEWQALPEKLEFRLDRAVVPQCCCWAVFWLAAHFICQALPFERFCFDYGGSAVTRAEELQSSELPTPPDTELPTTIASLEANQRRLRRQLVYYTVATCVGAHLMFQCLVIDAQQLPMNLVVKTSYVHRTFLTMGIGNFMVACWEEFKCWRLLGNVFRTHNNPQLSWLWNLVMHSGYIIHHFIATFAFWFCLCTGKLAGLCSIGLFFEAPFILATWRELALSQQQPLRWLRSWSKVRRLYLGIWVLFVITRIGASGLYFYAVDDRKAGPQWWSEVRTLDHDSLASFHVLGIFFTVLNCVMMAMFLMWCVADAEHCGQAAVPASSAADGWPAKEEVAEKPSDSWEVADEQALDKVQMRISPSPSLRKGADEHAVEVS